MLSKTLVLVLLLAVAVTGDIRCYKISNMTVAAGLAAGLALNSLQSGFSGLLGSLLSTVIPAAALSILFAMRMLGAGDIKLFCAIGSIMGIKFNLYAVLYSFLAGGIIALVIMLGRKNIKERFVHIATYLKSVYLSHALIPYTNFDSKSDGAKFHFSPAIAAGCCIQLLILLPSANFQCLLNV